MHAGNEPLVMFRQGYDLRETDPGGMAAGRDGTPPLPPGVRSLTD
jgi:hypothetical protein